MFKKNVVLLLVILCCTGCTVTYNLDISKNGFNEQISVFSNSLEENDVVKEYLYTIYYDMGENNVNPDVKETNLIYYNSELKKVNDLNRVNYSHLFSLDDFSRSRAIRSSFDNFIIRQYDHDDDGRNDYMLLSTTDSFSLFNISEKIENVDVNIYCHFKIISSNADEVKGNIHTWHFSRDNIKAVNMVYDPSVVVDDRSLWEKILDGDFINMFTIALFLFVIGIVIYFILKKKGDIKNKV